MKENVDKNFLWNKMHLQAFYIWVLAPLQDLYEWK